MTVRVGVLGAGFMGGTHARAYVGLPDVEVAAIYARSGDRAPALAADLGVAWTDDLRRVLTDPTIDAIDICLPTPEHRAATEAALAAGKHVLLEKPIAMTLVD
ncbi:MAG TPA: Gfo/Idh/MocA family oxidoreductase, partial [Thermomicrobiales bacterium]|nr:Gfo/Idh/MocA family oxidoreductase [Thermomicrobiales bacterium]